MLRQRPQMSEEEYREKLRSKGFNDAGEFIPDSTPMAPPVGFKRSPPLMDTIREMVRHEHLQRELAAQGVETFEEADDFDVEDDPFPTSKYEVPDDLEPIQSLRDKAAAAHPDNPKNKKNPPEPKGEGGRKGSRQKPTPDDPSPLDQPEDTERSEDNS